MAARRSRRSAIGVGTIWRNRARSGDVAAVNEMTPWRQASGENHHPRSLITVHFDVVRGCQLRCIGCANSVLQPNVERIAVADFAACLANIDVKAIKTFRMFNYGEALLHRQLPALLELLPRQKWQVQNVEISTNAQFAHWPTFEAALATRVLTRLVVSCDGDGTPESYEALRPPSRWKVLLQFLARAKEVRDRVHPELELITRTVCEDPVGQARWRQLLEPHGWRPEFHGWFDNPDTVRTNAMTVTPGKGICEFQSTTALLYVDADGSVVPCCAHSGAAILGSLKNNRLSEILASETRRAFRAALAVRDPSLRICAACFR